jgi:osmoprotectant transport system substrate-binding protein
MRRTRLVNRTVGVATALALAVTLAACGSSGGGSKSSGAAPASSAPAAAGSSSAPSSGGAAAPALPSGTGDAKLPDGQPGKGKPAITMGDKNFAEEYLLGSLYQLALQAKGFTVNLKGNIGSSAVIDKALTSGQIDMYPEYTGVIYTELAKLGDQPKTAAITLAGATTFENKRGFEVLNPTPFQDADGLAVSKTYAQKNGLKSIDDLSKVGSFSYAAPPENKSRYQGVVGLTKAYGLTKIKFVPLAAGSQYQALDQGKVNSIAIFTTDGQLAGGKYTVLSDTKGIFGYQQVVPVVSKKVLAQQGPAFQATLNAVSALLTTDAIVAMNKAVQLDHKDPAAIAKAFLQANQII